MNVAESISIACKRLITVEPFYGLFSIGLNRTISETKVSTACVSKRSIDPELTVNPNFWESLSPEHRVGLIKHELMHLAFNHIFMAKDFPNKELFNIAADLEINQYIDRSYLPSMGLTLEQFNLQEHRKKGTKFYYKKLQKDLEKGNSPFLSKLYQAMKDGKKVICSHETWKEFEEMSDAEQQVMQTHIETYVKDMVKSGKLQGKIPAELSGWVEAIMLDVAPVTDWRSLFRRMVGGATEVFTRKTRRKRSKRIPTYPGLKVKTKPLGAVYWDKSGSVCDEEHNRFFTEIHYMYKCGLNFDILPFNTEVLKPHRYRGEKSYSVAGGGTAFTPIAEHFNAHARNYAFCVILTDGYAEKPPKFKKPAIWVVTPEGVELESMKDWPGIKIKMNKND